MPEVNHNYEVVSEKEKVMIERVLHYYDIEINNVTRVKNDYKVESDHGIICVKKTKHGKNKAKNGFNLVESLNKAGFYHTPKYYKTIHGDSYVKYGKYILYVTEWIDGIKCDSNSLSDAESCAEVLARFHQASNYIDTNKLKIKNNLRNWPKLFYQNLLDLEKYRSIIDKKIIKTEFDNMYYDYIDAFYNRGVTALSILNNSNYYRISNKALAKNSICHHNFHCKNVVKKKMDCFVINLDCIRIDLQIFDFGKFIQGLMSKKEYQWDFKKAQSLIEHYKKYKPIIKDELEILLALLIFPYKFWKLGNKRYKKQKNWNEVKYSKKLNKLIKLIEEEQKFIVDFISYLNCFGSEGYNSIVN